MSASFETARTLRSSVASTGAYTLVTCGLRCACAPPLVAQRTLLDSLNRFTPCAETVPMAARLALSTATDVALAFQCDGVKSRVSLVLLMRDLVDTEILAQLQTYSKMYASEQTLRQAYKMASEDTRVVRRFTGLGILAAAFNPSLSISPLDTVSGPYYSIRQRSHIVAETTPALQSLALSMLQSLSKSSTYKDVSIAATRAVALGKVAN